MTTSIIFDPMIPTVLLIILAAASIAAVIFALWKGLGGWALRALAAGVVIAALSGPSIRQEDRKPLTDIVVLVEDQSASQQLSDRETQTRTSADSLAAQIAARPNTEVRRVVVPDGEGSNGTELMKYLADALAEEPRARIAGVLVISDGQVHDADLPINLPAPMHLLMTGHKTDWDRRLSVSKAPAFAIIGEPVSLTLRVDDLGAAPETNGRTQLDISVDGGQPQTFTIDIGREIELPITLPHGGRNVIRFSIPVADGELTDRNNAAVIQMNGIRDRLRVLLVSGEPHQGSRTWRNLLKSDSTVDLIHFTILRPLGKQDGIPVDELSLIAFPTRELFLEKIKDFDLIIFDRYQRRGILIANYLRNIANYVNEGGAVLIAAGPDFAAAGSIYRSPLGEVIPAAPTARVVEQPYLPKVTDLGQRHPVTTDLPDNGDWGRWMRQIDVINPKGSVVMTGHNDRPLLVLDRVGEGRVALLASDHAWLWNRGYEGGGPQMELLRRLAHWMMKEPELEEEALNAETNGQNMRIIRRTLKDNVPPVAVTAPDGTTETVTLEQTHPGVFEAEYAAPEMGLYRLENEDLVSVIGLGPAAPREFVDTIASADILQPAIEPMLGGAMWIEDGLPRLRNVRLGRPAAGRGWLGLTPREAYETQNIRQMPLLPGWLVLLLSASLITLAWLREGRR